MSEGAKERPRRGSKVRPDQVRPEVGTTEPIRRWIAKIVGLGMGQWLRILRNTFVLMWFGFLSASYPAVFAPLSVAGIGLVALAWGVTCLLDPEAFSAASRQEREPAYRTRLLGPLIRRVDERGLGSTRTRFNGVFFIGVGLVFLYLAYLAAESAHRHQLMGSP
jgi:hypothetical protein